ncbi:MAG: CCA tRNA nucleotidyltransferase [Chloroflexi bacterium]|nr:CCA tRNA nucleotidyltransferase [Chloroflexota bacterium]
MSPRSSGVASRQNQEPAAILHRLQEFLQIRSVSAYLVGGYIRNLLMGGDVRDVDIAVSVPALPLAQAAAVALGGHYVLLDEENQVARLVFSSPTPPGQWHIDLAALQGDIHQDLARRDFTVNAIALPLETLKGEGWRGKIIDPGHGVADTENRVLRAVSQSIFQDDPVRMMRGIRLAAQLGLTLDGSTRELMARHHTLLAQAAPERIREELCRLLACPQAAPWLSIMDEVGLLGILFPELDQARGVSQPKEHFWDVYHHSLETVASVEGILAAVRGEGGQTMPHQALRQPWPEELNACLSEEVGTDCSRAAILKLTALLHDIAKPDTRTVEPGGRIRFLGHADVGAQMALFILERLRFSLKERQVVARMIQHHLRPAQLARIHPPSRRAIYRYFRDTEEVGVTTLLLSLADHWATRGPQLIPDAWQQHVMATQLLATYYFQEQKRAVPPRLVDGHLLMEHFGLRPGPLVGELLEALREAQAVGDVTTQEEALALAQQELQRRQPSL